MIGAVEDFQQKKHYGSLTYAQEALHDEHHTGKSPQKCYSCIKEGTVLKRKGKHILDKSHVLLTTVEFATIISVLAVIGSKVIPLKLEIQLSERGLDHDQRYTCYMLALYEVVSCQG